MSHSQCGQKLFSVVLESHIRADEAGSWPRCVVTLGNGAV